MPAVLNAANEVAVQAFLNSTITFLDIVAVIEATMTQHTPVPVTDAAVAIQADHWARECALLAVEERSVLKTAW
jgi:1-deoxy-D-xylulose-5-phosphate reductoisomerase